MWIICDQCGEDILEGDKFINFDNNIGVCEFCIEDMTTIEILELLGYQLEEAEQDEPERECE